MTTSQNNIKKIVALVPCYNEASGIADVIKSFPIEQLREYHYDLEIVVIDNNSTDTTSEIARTLGATVLHEPLKGKGNAIRRGFKYIQDDTDYVIMLDGDATYRPDEMLRLIEPLNSGFCSVVLGSRLGGHITEGSMTPMNRFGNWMFCLIVRYLYEVNITDVLTGYFAWKREVIERLHPYLTSSGFAIEMEMVIKMSRLGESIYSVPISYDKRAGQTNLRPLYDGIRILWMFTKNLFWKPLVLMRMQDKIEKKVSEKKYSLTSHA
jgi:glycosyltransferase involved in cell wall biosynthesis